MDVIINLANDIFKPILAMGGPIIMLIILTVLALLFGVKFSKALEGGIKLAIALTGIGAIIGMLNGAFSASLAKFVENTGIQLNITDVGLGTTCYHHLGFCLDTLLLTCDVDCQRCDACNEENRYT